jgi:hypothetical protein
MLTSRGLWTRKEFKRGVLLSTNNGTLRHSQAGVNDIKIRQKHLEKGIWTHLSVGYLEPTR